MAVFQGRLQVWLDEMSWGAAHLVVEMDKYGRRRSFSTVTNWLKGRQFPDAEDLMVLVKISGRSSDWFLGLDEPVAVAVQE